MDSVSEKGIHTTVVMSSSQVGKSEFILNIIGSFVDDDPCPMMLINPSLTMSESFSKDRIDPMFRDTPALREKVGSRKTRDSGNTILHKKFTGGHLTLVGGNSPASMAARPIRILMIDEFSRLPVSTGGAEGEGDPYTIAKARTKNFHNRRIVVVSTPLIKNADRTEDLYENESDRRKYYLPCPHCGEMQPLEWKGIKFDKTQFAKKGPKIVQYKCRGCKELIDEKHKFPMLKAGKWIAEGESDGVAGFHISALYSPWTPWSEIVAEFLVAKKDPELLRAWTNTTLGETFEEKGDSLDGTSLMTRREPYPAEVPEGCLFLTAAVDVQSSPARLEVAVEGWGVGEENWKIAYYIIHGNLDQGKIWSEDLDDLLIRGSWEHESGRPMRISSTCIDSGGHHTTTVYNYCRKRAGQRIFAIKGKGGAGLPMVGPGLRKRTGRKGRPVELYILGVDSIKTLINNRLSVQDVGPGYVHFPIGDAFNEEYFAQLTAETVKHIKKQGITVRKWYKTRDRNEVFDNSVYNYAALVLLNPKWSSIVKRPKKQKGDTNEGTPQISKKKGRPSRRKSGGFANSWR